MTHKPSANPRKFVDRERIRELQSQGLSDREIAAIMGFQKQLIQRHRSQMGLPGGHGQGGSNRKPDDGEYFEFTLEADLKFARLMAGRVYQDARLTPARFLDLRGRQPQRVSYVGNSSAMAANSL